MARTPDFLRPDTTKRSTGNDRLWTSGNPADHRRDPYASVKVSSKDASKGRVRNMSKSGIEGDKSTWYSRPTKGS